MDEILKKLLEDQEQPVGDDCLNEEMSSLIMRCMQEEEDCNAAFEHVDTEHLPPDSEFFKDMQPELSGVGYTGITHMALPLIDVRMLSQQLRDLIETMTVWNYPVHNEPVGPKILSSRTQSHEHILKARTENDLRRRNEGKRILSSRG